MLDTYGRLIDTIRISVTDQCNLRCFYCYITENKNHNNPLYNNFLSFEKLYDILKVSVSLGIKRIKITGGEPLLRENIVDFIGMIKNIDEIEDISITTNGILLKEFAKDLKLSGLDRINVSIDSINRDIYSYITGSNELDTVLEGIEIAKNVGFDKIKINTVLLDCNKNSIDDIKKYCVSNNFSFQLINEMDLNSNKENFNNFEVTNRPPKCEFCNKIRITAFGELIPCLFSDISYKIDFNNIAYSIEQAINSKPIKGGKRESKAMYEIGG